MAGISAAGLSIHSYFVKSRSRVLVSVGTPDMVAPGFRGGFMDQREANIRATLAEKMARAIKRQKYDERQLIQVLRATPDKAKALLAGQLDGFATEEIRKMISVIE